MKDLSLLTDLDIEAMRSDITGTNLNKGIAPVRPWWDVDRIVATLEHFQQKVEIVVPKRIRAEDIEAYSIDHECSLSDASRSLKRLKFLSSIKTSYTLSEFKNIIIEILNFEFGGYE